MDTDVLALALSAAARKDIVRGYRGLQARPITAIVQKAAAPAREHRRALSCWLAVRRACAKSFVTWCAKRCIDVLVRPLPYGCVHRYLEVAGLRGSTNAQWLVRQARAL